MRYGVNLIKTRKGPLPSTLHQPLAWHDARIARERKHSKEAVLTTAGLWAAIPLTGGASFVAAFPATILTFSKLMGGGQGHHDYQQERSERAQLERDGFLIKDGRRYELRGTQVISRKLKRTA